MFCTFCNEAATKLVTHELGECCLAHLKSRHESTTSRTQIVPCVVCFKGYREDELQRHQEMCMPRLVFRCSLCEEDYLTKESLWNHLIGHQIIPEKHELYYQEKVVTYKQFTCSLCNDKRSYPESCYWQHVHEDHDGYYLRCPECGDNFRSKKRLNDHSLNICKSREQEAVIETVMPATVTENKTNDTANIVTDRNVGKACNNETSVSKLSDEIHTSVANATSDKNVKSSNKRPTFNCVHCEKKCLDSKSLSIHMENCHLPTTCDICGVLFDSGNKCRYHKQVTHSEHVYKCRQCTKRFRIKSSYHRHLASHHKVMNVCCNICNRKIRNSTVLAKHMIVAHGDASAINQKAFKTGCPKCRISFTDKKELADHVLNFHELIICDICSTTFAGTKEQSNHECTMCPYCGKQCYNSAALTEHIHEKHEPTACDICGALFVVKSQIHYHKLISHSKPKFKCPHCSVKFHVKHAYERHLELSHKGRSYPCKICGRKYNKSINLSYHMEFVHGVERIKKKSSTEPTEHESEEDSNEPQKDKLVSTIEIGNVTFVKQEFQSEHVDAVEQEMTVPSQNDGRKTTIQSSDTKCLKCGKEFFHKERLAAHVARRHKLFQCDICQSSIVGSDKMSAHKLKAHSAPKYKCLRCPEKFHLKQSLRKHVTSHDSIYKHSSKTCDRRFKSIQNLRHHLKKNHSKRITISDRKPVESVETVEETPEDDVTKSMSKSDDIQINVSPEYELDHSSVKGPNGFNCMYCDKKYSTPSVFTRHVENRHLPAVCDICGDRFNTGNKCNYHKQMVHPDHVYTCQLCSKVIPLKDRYVRHMAAHHRAKKFSCKICNLELKSCNMLAKHMIITHGDTSAMNRKGVKHVCRICKESVSDRKQLSDHVEKVHKATLCEICAATFYNADQRKNHKCTICAECGKQYHTLADLTAHIQKLHEPAACDICGASFVVAKLMNDHKSVAHSEPKFQCSNCSTKFHLKQSYRRHMKFCSENRMFPCKQCNQAFKTSVELSLHMTVIHGEPPGENVRLNDGKEQQPDEDSQSQQEDEISSNPKDSTREEGNNSDNTAQSSRSGNNLIHYFDNLNAESEPKYSCPYCSEKFRFDSSLRQHECFYKSSNNYSCKMCKLRYKDSQSLEDHMKKRHDELRPTSDSTSDTEEQCKDCNKTYPDKKALKRHIMINHIPRTCKICGTITKSSHRLNYHKLKYHSQPKHECPHCSMKFYMKDRLTRHVAKHKEKQFPCPFCSLMYDSSFGLNVHIRRIHPDEKEKLGNNQAASKTGVKLEPLS